MQQLKFHGEDQSSLSNVLLILSACGILGYSALNVIAGGLSRHNDIKNLLVFGTGAISIMQVLLQLLFITDAQRRRVHTASQNRKKPGRQVRIIALITRPDKNVVWHLFAWWSAQLLSKKVEPHFCYHVGFMVSSLAILLATWYSP